MVSFSFSRTYKYPIFQVWNWHKNILALERLTPPWDKVTVIKKKNLGNVFLKDGEITIQQEILPLLKAKWRISHMPSMFKEGVSFSDKLVSGPIKKWQHNHNFIKTSKTQTTIKDEISFSHWINVRKLNNFTLESMEKSFKYRADILEHDLSNAYKNTNGYYVLITGSSGLVGSALVPLLNSLGYKIVFLKYEKHYKSTSFNDCKIRYQSKDLIEIPWNPYISDDLRIPDDISKKIRFVVNLSGENILGIWTKSKKKLIINSRLISTRSLLKVLERNSIKTKCCVHASAVGYYGLNKKLLLDEYDSSGYGFLAETTKEWEKEQNKFRKLTQRNVNLRIGAVLSSKGGLIKQIELPFKAGLGSFIGKGDNFVNWILLEDLVRIIEKSFNNKDYDGAINAVSPEPIQSKDLFYLLAKKYKSKFFINIPSYIPRFFSKELADEVILSSQQISPRKLLKNKYKFLAPTIHEALDIL